MFGEIAPKQPGGRTQNPGQTPPGAMMPWLQADVTLPVPAGWALCNGQVATWQTGPRAGKTFTTPNMVGLMMLGTDVFNGTSTANPSGYGKLTPQTLAGSTTSLVAQGGAISVGGGSLPYVYPQYISNLNASFCLPWIVKL